APARRRGRPPHHPRRLRGASGAHPHAGTRGPWMMWQAARALMLRDLRLLWRRRGDALQPALLALLVVVLFALGMGTGKPQLARAAGAVLWLAVLLAGLLSLDSLFRGDAEDG